MIASFRFKLRAVDPVDLPSFSGTVASSLFLRLIAAADPGLASRIHRGAVAREYAVTPFLVRGSYFRGRVNAGGEFEFRASMVSDRLTRTVVDSVASGEGGKLELGGSRVYLEEIEAVVRDYGDLGGGCFPAVKVRFLTPVRFSVASTVKRQRPKFRLFPTPEHVFHSLMDHWNMFAPEGLKAPDEVRDFVQNYVVETAYKIRKKVLEGTGGRVFVGTVGWVVFSVMAEEEEPCSWLARLLEYGRFFNVGTGRSIGLGVMDYQPLPRSGLVDSRDAD